MKIILKNKYVMVKILLSAFLCFFLTMGFFYTSAKADGGDPKNFVILLNTSGQSNAQIFSENDGLWAPGATKAKKFALNNTSKYDFILENIKINFSITDRNNLQIQEGSKIYDEFLNSMELALSDESGIFYQGTLHDLYQGGNVSASKITIPSNSEKVFNLKVSMDKSSSNSLQDLTSICDISVFSHSIDDGNGDGSIVKTGTLLDNKVLIFIGSSIFSCGLLLLIKKRTSKY